MGVITLGAGSGSPLCCFTPAVLSSQALLAGPWVSNVNCKLQSADLPLAKAIARSVAERHGGLPGVQAMALLHIEGVHQHLVLCEQLAGAHCSTLHRSRGGLQYSGRGSDDVCRSAGAACGRACEAERSSSGECVQDRAAASRAQG